MGNTITRGHIRVDMEGESKVEKTRMVSLTSKEKKLEENIQRTLMESWKRVAVS